MLDLLASSRLTPVFITLTLEQMRWVVRVGLDRAERSFREGYGHKYGYRDEKGRARINIEGAGGELAAALALGVPWAGDPFNRGPDLGTRTQVRHTELPRGSLIVRGDDRDSDIFILVTGTGPHYVVHGWLWCHEAKRPEFLNNAGNDSRPACWMVRQNRCPPLRNLSELEGLDL